MGDIGNAADFKDNIINLVFKCLMLFMRHQNEDIKNTVGYIHLLESRDTGWR